MVTTTHADVASNIELLSAWIEAQMAHRAEPGLSIGIVHDQELVWAHGFGHADLDNRVAATADTRYRIASVTKLFTATAILILRDAGMLQLDDPVDRHLPWFDIRQRYPDAPPITIRHLLTHTAGLPREAAFPYWTDDSFPTRDQVREALPRQETAYPTETRWKYSNLALALAGEIVAAVSGQAYEDFVQQRILDPLGHERHPDPGTASRQTPGWPSGTDGGLPGSGRAVLGSAPDFKGITPAANMTSTVGDLAKFAMLQFRDGPAVRPPGVARQHAAGDAAGTLAGSGLEAGLGPGIPRDARARRYLDRTRRVGAWVSRADAALSRRQDRRDRPQQRP